METANAVTNQSTMIIYMLKSKKDYIYSLATIEKCKRRTNELKSDNQNATSVGGRFFLYGIDASLSNTGVAIFDLETKEFVYIGSFSTEGIKATKEYKRLDVNALKLHKLSEWFKNLTEKYPPYFVTFEQMVKVERQFGVNINEIKGIAKATGVLQEAVWNIPQEFYYPSEVKASIIRGNAKKELVRDEILKRYPSLVFDNLDESDACAVALCQLINIGIVEWEKPVEVKQAKSKPRKKKNT